MESQRNRKATDPVRLQESVGLDALEEVLIREIIIGDHEMHP